MPYKQTFAKKVKQAHQELLDRADAAKEELDISDIDAILGTALNQLAALTVEVEEIVKVLQTIKTDQILSNMKTPDKDKWN